MNHISNMANSADMTLKPPGNVTLTGDLSVGWQRRVERFYCYMMATERQEGGRNSGRNIVDADGTRSHGCLPFVRLGK